MGSQSNVKLPRIMDDDSLVRKTYNFICGSGGMSTVSQLVKNPSPLKGLQTEEEVRKWLRIQTQKDRRFVLIIDQRGKITGLRIDLRKKICPQYWLQGTCNRSEGKCKYWHICRNYIKGTCEGSCSRSHDFRDDVNEWKVRELELEKFDNGSIRNIVSRSLPQVCLLYARGECLYDSCPYLHVNCSVEAPASFASTLHQLTNDHNKAILRQFDLVPHQGMKVEFIQCNILVPCRQERYEPANYSSAGSEGNVALTRNNESIEETCSQNQDLPKMPTLLARSENQKMLPTVLTSQYLPSCPRKEGTISFSKRKRHGRKKATEQHQMKVERKKSLGSEEEFDAPVPERNNLGMIESWKCSQTIPDFLNIQEEGGQKSLVASVDCSKTIHAKEQISNPGPSKDVKMPKNSGVRGQVVSPIPSNIPLPENATCSNTIASLDKMGSQKSKVMSNADAVRSLVMNEKERLQDSPVIEKLHDRSVQVLFECLCKEYNCSAPFPVLQKREDLWLSNMEDARSWLRARTDKFVTIEDDRGSIKHVTAFCPKLRLCLEYMKSGKCSKTECSYFHLCKQYITGHCGENCGQNHQFQNELDKRTLSVLKLDWLTSQQLRQLMRSSVPQVCINYNNGRCANAITCSRMHICKMYVSASCKDGDQCHLAHKMAVGTEHSRSLLGKYRLAKVKTEQLLKMILVCDDTVNNASEPKSAGASCEGTPRWIPDGTNDAMFKTGFTQRSCNLPHSRLENDAPECVRKLSVSSSYSSTIERSNENPPSKKAVFECICKEYSCSVSFAVISERSDLFHEGCGNVASWFRGKRESFMLGENEDGTVSEVTAVCRRARLCFGYTSYKKCSKDSCQYLHVCRAYVAGFCRFGYRCSMEHSFQSERNRKLISKFKLDGLTDEELYKVVQNSSPQVCLEYNGGLCPKGDKCSRIHICKNFIKRKCDHEDACSLGHEAALKTPRAKEILKKFDINQELAIGTILRMLQLSDDAPLFMRTTMTTSHTELGSTTPTKVVGEGHENRGCFSMATADQENKPEPVPIPAPVAAPVAVPRFFRNTLSGIKSEPSESKVFESLCKDYNCSVQFSVIAKRKDLFPEECKDIEFWFRKWKSSFLLTVSRNGSISSVDAFSARARLCLSYTNSGTCVKSNCLYLHMCRDYVTDNCSYGATCTRNHSFHNERDKTFLASVKLDQLTNEQLRKLVLSSAPQVCLDYNSGSCESGVSCTRIHVCKDFLRKNCKNGYLCDLDHESAMATDHAQAVLERYHFNMVASSDGQMDVLQKQIFVCDGQDWSGKNNGHVHKNKPKTPICCDFLLGKCKKGVRCSGHHCFRPFHWQYKAPHLDEWKSFNEKDNDTLESLFCDPSQDENRIKGLRMCLDSTGPLASEIQADVYLEDRLMVLLGGLITQIRRLSTESCVTNPNNPLATNWIWRWEDEHRIWREYRHDRYGQDLQKLIETAFLNPQGPVFTFSMPEHDYQVYFHSTSMFQQNIKYQTKRNVRRRPLIMVTDEDLRQRKSQNRGAVSSAKKQQTQSGTLPSHWSPMSLNDQFIRVKLAPSSIEFQEVQTSFTKTIRDYVTILSIERVQNPFMWEKFRRKRENMAAVKTRNREGKSVKEKQLFHGTSPEAVTAICKQNFDWRLHGKNATMYGEGSYFAVNASYSHNYAKADTDSCRYMFLADVLVGSYTKGKSSFRRPPPLQSWNPESDLFDSCVDDEVHPTIFVVFDTDQFYPAYIIKYSVRSLSSVPAVQHFVSPSRPSTAAQVSPAVYTPSAYPVSQGRGKDKCSLM